MIGLSKQTLEKIRDSDLPTHAKEFVQILIDQCEELDPWLPIEYAPKTHRVLLLFPESEAFKELVTHGSCNPWSESCGILGLDIFVSLHIIRKFNDLI